MTGADVDGLDDDRLTNRPRPRPGHRVHRRAARFSSVIHALHHRPR